MKVHKLRQKIKKKIPVTYNRLAELAKWLIKTRDKSQDSSGQNEKYIKVLEGWTFEIERILKGFGLEGNELDKAINSFGRMLIKRARKDSNENEKT